MSKLDWNGLVEMLRRRDRVPAAQANAELLDAAAERWRGRVEPWTSMHTLVFTRLEDRYPFPRSVRVAADDGEFSLCLVLDHGDESQVVASESAVTASAALVALDRFLETLIAAE